MSEQSLTEQSVSGEYDLHDPGHGSSPAAWVAVTIGLVAFAIGTLAFWFDLPVARLGVGRAPGGRC